MELVEVVIAVRLLLGHILSVGSLLDVKVSWECLMPHESIIVAGRRISRLLLGYVLSIGSLLDVKVSWECLMPHESIIVAMRRIS